MVLTNWQLSQQKEISNMTQLEHTNVSWQCFSPGGGVTLVDKFFGFGFDLRFVSRCDDAPTSLTTCSKCRGYGCYCFNDIFLCQIRGLSGITFIPSLVRPTVSEKVIIMAIILSILLAMLHLFLIFWRWTSRPLILWILSCMSLILSLLIILINSFSVISTNYFLSLLIWYFCWELISFSLTFFKLNIVLEFYPSVTLLSLCFSHSPKMTY